MQDKEEKMSDEGLTQKGKNNVKKRYGNRAHKGCRDGVSYKNASVIFVAKNILQTFVVDDAVEDNRIMEARFLRRLNRKQMQRKGC